MTSILGRILMLRKFKLTKSVCDYSAMENWVSQFLVWRDVLTSFGQGLITGRTTAYLLDPKNENLKSKIRIAGIQTHEVAHQVRHIILSNPLVS